VAHLLTASDRKQQADIRPYFSLPLEGRRPREAGTELPGRCLVCQPGSSFFSALSVPPHVSGRSLHVQTVNYACASVALLNIINNIDEIDLGEQLQQFKDFTMPFTPALRGDAIGNFEFVKRIHNSFARYCYSPRLRGLRFLLTT
jgi:hypothetical protein